MSTADDTSDTRTLPFWVLAEEPGDEENDSMGMFRGGDGEACLRNVPLGPFRKNLAEAIDALQQVFTEATDRGGVLPLQEAHLTFQVTASGGVQFIGTAQAQRSNGIVLVFRR